MKPMTVGLILLTGLWGLFQWKDPTPPPVLDQIMVAAFGVWFANEAIDKSKGRRNVKINKDGSVSISEDPDDDETDSDEEEDDV
ncbi:hypothetical protein [Mycolicibacterium peregrinum]|uniref:hypothetical protein n=1 Tax=Mycolicibacterium peregrinum TaxID=43304 RepID=UPI003AAE8505